MSYAKLFTLALFSILLITTAFAQPPSRGRAIEMIIAGDNSLQMLDLERAIEFYSSAISLDPSYADAYMKRSNAFAISGRNTEAQADYNKALELNPYINYIYDKRGKIQVLIADFMGTLIDVDKANTIKPEIGDMMQSLILADMRKAYPQKLSTIDSLVSEQQATVELLTIRALALWENGDLSGAVRTAEEAIAMGPSDAFTKNVFGLLLIQTGNYEGALIAFNDAIKLNDKYAEAFLNRGRTFSLLSNKVQALQDFNKALQLDTANAMAYYARGIYFKELGNADAAIADYTALINLRPNFADAYFSRGFAEKMKGIYTDALIDYDRAIELNPNSALYYNNRGIVKTIAGRNFEAEKDYKMAISLQPDYAAAYHNLGMTLIMNHSRDEGCSNIETSINKGLVIDKEIYRYFCAQ